MSCFITRGVGNEIRRTNVLVRTNRETTSSLLPAIRTRIFRALIWGTSRKYTLHKMANIGRAYCRIMPTAAALLRDILRKEKKKGDTGQDEEARSLEVGRCPGCRCYKCLRTRDDSPLCINTNFGIVGNAAATCALWKEQLGNGNSRVILTSIYCSADYYPTDSPVIKQQICTKR